MSTSVCLAFFLARPPEVRNLTMIRDIQWNVRDPCSRSPVARDLVPSDLFAQRGGLQQRKTAFHTSTYVERLTIISIKVPHLEIYQLKKIVDMQESRGPVYLFLHNPFSSAHLGNNGGPSIARTRLD